VCYKLVHVKAGTVIIDANLIHNRGDGRFRFTCAHELAHWVLDKEYFQHLGETAAMSKKIIKSSEVASGIERQANRLACFLLMPKGTVKSAFHETKCRESATTVLAKQFNVSQQAMGIRLKEMGLIQ
jgi:Zn-dependent peptidase ImmA (M78 family)